MLRVRAVGIGRALCHPDKKNRQERSASPGQEPGLYDHRARRAVLVVKNRSIVGNSGPGIVIAPASGAIGADLEDVTSAYNTYGIAVGSGGRVTIKNSFFTNNIVVGIEGDPGSFIEVKSSKMSSPQRWRHRHATESKPTWARTMSPRTHNA